MSSFEENIINKIKRMAHDIERLKVGEKDSTAYLGGTAVAADSDKLDGQHGSYYLSTAGTAANSDLVDNAHASATPTADTIPITDGAGKLAVGWIPTTIDADKLDGLHAATSGADAHVLATDASGNAVVSGTLGVGVTSPVYKLEVNGSIKSKVNSYLSFVDEGNGLLADDGYGTSAFSLTRKSNKLSITGLAGIGFVPNSGAPSTNYSMVIDDAGKVGIGTTTPGATLHISGSTNAKSRIFITNTAGTSVSDVMLNLFDGTTQLGGFFGTSLAYSYAGYPPGSVGIMANQAGGSYMMSTEVSAHIRFFTGGEALTNERMRITNAGNVGIGITAPTARLHIVGNADTQQLIVKANATQTANVLEVQNSSATVLVAVDGAGKVGIGLTPTANMAGLSIEAGCMTVKERTTPTADADYGKIYCKNDNKLYFQDGAGAEHEVALAT